MSESFEKAMGSARQILTSECESQVGYPSDDEQAEWCKSQEWCTDCFGNLLDRVQAAYDREIEHYVGSGAQLTLLQRALYKDYGIDAKWDGLRHVWAIEADTTRRTDQLRAAWHEGYTAALHRRETETWKLDRERMEAVRRIRDCRATKTAWVEAAFERIGGAILGENGFIVNHYEDIEKLIERLIHLLGGDGVDKFQPEQDMSQPKMDASNTTKSVPWPTDIDGTELDYGDTVHDPTMECGLDVDHFELYGELDGPMWYVANDLGYSVQAQLCRKVDGDELPETRPDTSEPAKSYDRLKVSFGLRHGTCGGGEPWRTVAVERLLALRFDGDESENLGKIAYAIYPCATGWTCESAAGLRDKLIKLMGGVSDDGADCDTLGPDARGHSAGCDFHELGVSDGGRGLQDCQRCDARSDAAAGGVGEQATTITDELRECVEQATKSYDDTPWHEMDGESPERHTICYVTEGELLDIIDRIDAEHKSACNRLKVERDTAEIERDKLKHDAERDADLIESMVGDLNDTEAERDRLKAERDALQEHCRNQQKQLAEFNRVMNTWHWNSENYKQWCPMSLDRAVRKAEEKWESACGRIGELKDERDDLKMRLREFADDQKRERKYHQQRIKKLLMERDAARHGQSPDEYRGLCDELENQRDHLLREIARLSADRDRYKESCEAAQSLAREMMDGLQDYIELPKDVYGEHVRPGDTLADGKYPFVVDEVAYDGERWSVRNKFGVAWALCDVYHIVEGEES